MLKGKSILLCVTGGIAVYKSVILASLLLKENAEVEVIMTNNATNFISPLTFESLIKRKCYTNTFDVGSYNDIKHVSLAEKSDLVIVSPATANICAKLAHGICDDMLTTTILACDCKKIICPSMNTNMYNNPVTQDNLKILQSYGWTVINPVLGLLACGDVGLGKLPEPEDLLQYILKEVAFEKDYLGKKVLVTAGPTEEAIDPIRFITNHSTGKMGYAIAFMAMLRGAEVTLVSGRTNEKHPPFVKVINVVSSEEMYNCVMENYKDKDFIFKSAAVSDFTPCNYSIDKIKKCDSKFTLNLCRTKDILRTIGERKLEKQVICGFSMETKNLIENSKNKLINKKLDMICANNVMDDGAGFGEDTNLVTIITKNQVEKLSLMSKKNIANIILDKALVLHKLKK